MKYNALVSSPFPCAIAQSWPVRFYFSIMNNYKLTTSSDYDFYSHEIYEFEAENDLEAMKISCAAAAAAKALYLRLNNIDSNDVIYVI